MKNLITAAIIALTATAAHADRASAIDCVNGYFDNHPRGTVLTESGRDIVESLATVYELGEFLEGKYEKTRETVKVIFGSDGGEINYCFRQHMGE